MERWHGTRRGYDDESCRCAECRACNADRVRRWRAAGGEPRIHPWREYVHEQWHLATIAWEARREEIAIGYATEQAEFERDNPRPRFKDFLVFLAA